MTDSEHRDGVTQYTEAVLPLMSLREVVMFPRSIIPLFVGRDASIKAVEAALKDYNKKIFLVAQREPEKERPGPEDLYDMGTVAKILQLLRLPDGTVKVLFEGLYRATCPKDVPFSIREGFPLVLTKPLAEQEEESAESDALVRLTHEAVESFGRINKKLPQESIMAMLSLKLPGRLADAIVPHLKLDFVKKQEILEITDPMERLETVYTVLQSEVEVFSMEKRIKSRVKKQLEKNHKEYYLNEQLKAINKEMGREGDPKQEVDELEERLKGKDMPDEAREKCAAELKKLRQIQPSSAEYTVVRNYVDWILDLPWNKTKETNTDLAEAQKILDEDHYGLEKPKERILEYLAVDSIVNTLKGPIICLVGPPGVGKTSIAKSIARATNREFVRVSLGGVRDEAEIRGHRRTYVGALPGKIIQSLKRAQHNNPVFCLDEIDKLSNDFRGDPASALLEVLDPEQNNAFGDHYLDLDYDLSKVFFITTANQLHTIPLPLQDRMEIIKLPGYLETEKKHIARDFLFPKQLEMHGLSSENISLSDNGILEIVRHYTKEAGVRSLEREIASVCRKVTKKLVEEKDLKKTVNITKTSIPAYLGVHKFRFGEREENPQVGVTTGLAWTQLGGELLVVEVALMPGSGKVEITGKLGDVMQESARAALSYVRSRAENFGLRSDFYKDVDIHVHVPEGATPKDGPSAGITLATSLVSVLLNKPVRNDLAMTGEITLRGRVLPIGGLREKLLAAHRGLLSKVLIPKDNEKDLKDVPAEILKDLEIKPVEHMDEVLPEALLEVEPEHLFCGQGGFIPVSHSLLKEEFRRKHQ
ncbi:MAG: endopeptidase La [Desulfovibrionales bacterium]